MTTIREALWCVLLAVLIACGVAGFQFIRHADQRAGAVDPKLVAAITANLKTATDNAAAVSGRFNDLAGQLADPKTGVAASLQSTVKSIGKTADNLATTAGNVNTLAVSLNAQVNAVGGSLTDPKTGAAATLAGIRSDLQPPLLNVQTITGNFATLTGSDGDLPGALRDTRFFLARGARAMGHIEQAADAFEASAKEFHADLPRYLALGQGIGDDVHGITGNVRKLTTPKWYDRALGYAFTGLAIYRDLNPATNFIQSLTQWKTTRP